MHAYFSRHLSYDLTLLWNKLTTEYIRYIPNWTRKSVPISEDFQQSLKPSVIKMLA